MKKIVMMMVAMAFVVSPAYADDHKKWTDDEKAIMDVLTGIFDGMREGDAGKHRVFFLPDTNMGRMTQKGEYQASKAEDWSKSISALTPGAVDEQLHDVKIMVEGTLAMAWTPFTLNVDGELRSCGVNQFTLGKTPEGWKVLYAIDIHTPQKCMKTD